jgi:DNA relaxase NicK
MKADILIDFLTFTVRGYSTSTTADRVISEILELDPLLFEKNSKGFNFYTDLKDFNGIKVLYNGRVNRAMGICVNMAGSACRAYETHHKITMIQLLKKISTNKAVNVTRLDIALDDRAGHLDMDIMWDHAHKNLYRSRITSKNFHQSCKSNSQSARTIYFGGSASLFKIRIYEKNKQMYDPTDPKYNQHWIRFEIVFKGDYAMQVADIVSNSENISASVAGIVSDKFNFIIKNNKRINRCSVASWWSGFLDEVQKVSITPKPKTDHTIDKHEKWLFDTISRIAAKVALAVGRERFADDFIQAGIKKLTTSDWTQIDDYRKKHGLPPVEQIKEESGTEQNDDNADKILEVLNITENNRMKNLEKFLTKK